MSDIISILIAYVGFLIVFSMLVQAVQEALKGAFKLKTGVWESFLVSLYKQELKVNGSQDAKESGFWSRVLSGDFIGDFDSRLRRLREVVVKADDLLQEVKKTLLDITETSPGNPYSANLIVPKMQVLAVKLRTLTGLKLDTLLTTYDKFSNNAVSGLVKALHTFENTYPELGPRVKDWDDRTMEEFRKRCEELLAAIVAVEKKISDYRNQIEERMDAWMAQVNEEYRRNMLKWTVVIGMVLVVVFNADSFSIFKYLSVDATAREKIMANVETYSKTTIRSKAEGLDSIADDIKNNQKDAAKKKMEEFSTGLESDFKMLGAAARAEETAKFRAGLSGKPAEPAQETEVLTTRLGTLTRMYLQLHKIAIDYHVQGISTLELPLGWVEDYQRIKLTAGRYRDDCSEFVLFAFKKTGGLLLTTFLITFGAPFWNDILSALFGLKNSLNKDKAAA